ncbi:MAG: efflux RND transporter periplasmic adaptor subunit [Phycisphaeraceae bacterium]
MTSESNESAGNRSRRQMVLHVIRRGIAIVVLLIVLGSLYLYWERSEHAPGVQTPPEQPPPVVSTIIVEGETVALAPRYIGQVEASQVVEIRARVSGFMEERAFEEGAVVQPGERLYRIDPRSFQAELEIAQSRLTSARARREQAQQQLQRYERLAERGAATATELEEWQTTANVAEAEVQLAQAQIAQAELDLGYTTIESPIEGVIGESQQDVGAYVSAGADSLLAVVSQLNPIYVRLSISEEETLQLQAMVEGGEVQMPDVEDLEVLVTLSTGREYPHHGQINFVDVRVDPRTGTRVVRATVPNPDQLLVPGQSIHATILGATRTGTLVVPQRAVMQTPTGSAVYVVQRDGTVEQREVTLGEWHKDQWIIEEGLTAGDRVVTDQLMRLRPGLEVRLSDQATGASSDSSNGSRPQQTSRR